MIEKTESPLTDDLRIGAMKTLMPPRELMAEIPATPDVAETVARARKGIQRVLCEDDDRLVVVVGPCSIHDPDAALEYAGLLAAEQQKHQDQLLIVMRVYFEKPRTTVGWKGLINDPGLDDSFEINRGLRIARGLLRDINALGLPTGTEFLDSDQSAVHCGPCGLGRDRCPNDREPGSPRARLGFVLSGWF